ncbi:hypothetical protein [Sphingopyxis fribergensis]
MEPTTLRSGNVGGFADDESNIAPFPGMRPGDRPASPEALRRSGGPARRKGRALCAIVIGAISCGGGFAFAALMTNPPDLSQMRCELIQLANRTFLPSGMTGQSDFPCARSSAR